MPLNLSDGDFLPFLQYDAKAGRWFAKAEGAAERVEIEKPTLVFDMPNIKTGWIKYPTPAEGGGPPEHIWDGSPTDPTQKAPRPPGEGWKRGFEVYTFSNAIIPGTQSKLAMRSFSSNAFGVNSVMAGMFCEYEAKAADNPGKLPVFACKGVRPFENNYGTVYEPTFELIAWVDRAKVPAFDAYRESRVQILPPPPQQRRIAATAPNGGSMHAPLQHPQQQSRQFVSQDRGSYKVSSMQAAPGRPDVDELAEDEVPF